MARTVKQSEVRRRQRERQKENAQAAETSKPIANNSDSMKKQECVDGSKTKAKKAKSTTRAKKWAKSKEKRKTSQNDDANSANEPIVISEDEEDNDGDQTNSIYSISDSDDNSGTKEKTEEDYIALTFSDEDDTKSEKTSKQDQPRGKKRSREDTYSTAIANDNNSDDDENDLSIFYPWWRSYIGQPENRLQAEVENFVDYLQPVKHEILLRHYLVHKIRYTIQQCWPDADVQVFGSFKTNTFLPDSDMDLAVTLPVYQGNRTLYALADDLKSAGTCLGTPEVIASATVPVIKFVESLTHLKVDIIVSSRNGVECAEYVSDVLDRYPGARKLTLIAKHMVALQKLNEVFTGGIGGYGLVCMVISFLQMHPKVAAGMIDPEDNLGVLLLDFLQLYGIQFAIGNVGINVVGSGSYYSQRSYCKRKGRPVFSIQDPMDSTNDIGIKSFNAVAVVKLFRNAYLTTFTKTLEEHHDRTGKSKARRHAHHSSTKSHNTCLLSSGIALIPETMVNQRQLMQQIYSSRRWENEPASKTFDWNMAL